MEINFKPLGDRILVKPEEQEQKSKGGLILTDSVQRGQKVYGTVVAVGNGKKDHTMTVKVGDTVLYGKYSGTELKYEGTDYLIMKEEEIYAILG